MPVVCMCQQCMHIQCSLNNVTTRVEIDVNRKESEFLLETRIQENLPLKKEASNVYTPLLNAVTSLRGFFVMYVGLKKMSEPIQVTRMRLL